MAYNKPYIQYRYLSSEFLLRKANANTVNLYNAVKQSMATLNCGQGDSLDQDINLSESLFENRKRGPRSIDLLRLVEIVAAEQRGDDIPVHYNWTLAELKKFEIPRNKIHVSRLTHGNTDADQFSLFLNEDRESILVANNGVPLLGLVSGAIALTGSCVGIEANDDAISTAPSVLVNFDTTTNDDVSACTSPVYSLVTPPTKGVMSINSNGTGSYTPNPGVANTTDVATAKVTCDSVDYLFTINITITNYTFLLVDDYFAVFATEQTTYDISTNDPAECASGVPLTYVLLTTPTYATSYNLTTAGIITYTADIGSEFNQEILTAEAYCNGQPTGITQLIIIDIFMPPSSLPVIDCVSVIDNSVDLAGTEANYVRIQTSGGYDSGIVEYSNSPNLVPSPVIAEGDLITLSACYDDACFYVFQTTCYAPTIDEGSVTITVNSATDLSDVDITATVAFGGGESGLIRLIFLDSNSDEVYQEDVSNVTTSLNVNVDLGNIADIATLRIQAISNCAGQDECIGVQEDIDFCATATGLIYEDLNCLVLQSGLNNGNNTITYTFVNSCLPCAQQETPEIIEIQTSPTNTILTFNPDEPYYQVAILDTDNSTVIQESSWTEFSYCNVVDPPSARFNGDNTSLGVEGFGNPMIYIGGASGNFITTYELQDNLGNPLGPSPGYTFFIGLYTPDDQLMASATYDYSSAISLDTDTPTITSGGSITVPQTYSDSTASPIAITWADVQSHMVTGANVLNSSGAGNISFNKKDFATALGLTDADAFIYTWKISVTDLAATSALSKSCTCLQSSAGNIDNVYTTEYVKSDKAMLFGDSTTLHGLHIISDAQCPDFPIVKSTTSTISDGSRLSQSSQGFTVNGEEVMLVGGPDDATLDLRYYYRNATAESFAWSSLYSFETVLADVETKGVMIDSVNTVNSRPQIYVYIGELTNGSLAANPSPFNVDLYHIYWDGAAWTETLVSANISASPNDDRGWRDPSTGDMYFVGASEFYRINYTGADFTTGETTDPSNYSAKDTLLTATTTQGSLSTSVTGQSPYLTYAGDYNTNPSFISSFGDHASINWIYWNGAAWANKIIATFAESSSATSGTITESTTSFDIIDIKSMSQAYATDVTDVTQALNWYIHDSLNDRILLAEFTAGDLSNATYTINITSFVDLGTAASPTVSQIF